MLIMVNGLLEFYAKVAYSEPKCSCCCSLLVIGISISYTHTLTLGVNFPFTTPICIN